MKINEIVIGGEKVEEEKSAVDQIIRYYESRKKVTELLDNYSRITSKAKYKVKQGKEIKILSP